MFSVPSAELALENHLHLSSLWIASGLGCSSADPSPWPQSFGYSMLT